MTERDPTHETMTEDTRATETEPNRPTTERTDYRPELGDVSHTNPYTEQVFGDTQTYGRGKAVAADGGEANIESRPSSEAGASDGRARDADEEAGASDDDRDVDEETMEDVAHEPPGDADGAQAAYDRGAGDE